MLSRTGEHALRAVLYLARLPEGSSLAAAEIADALGLPRNYLSKTLHRLTRIGVLVSERGRNGGFRLGRSAASLPVSTVIGEFETTITTGGRCMLGDRPCDPQSPCVAHERWTTLTGQLLRLLSDTTVAGLLGATEAAPATGPVTRGHTRRAGKPATAGAGATQSSNTLL